MLYDQHNGNVVMLGIGGGVRYVLQCVCERSHDNGKALSRERSQIGLATWPVPWE